MMMNQDRGINVDGLTVGYCNSFDPTIGINVDDLTDGYCSRFDSTTRFDSTEKYNTIILKTCPISHVLPYMSLPWILRDQ